MPTTSDPLQKTRSHLRMALCHVPLTDGFDGLRFAVIEALDRAHPTLDGEPCRCRPDNLDRLEAELTAGHSVNPVVPAPHPKDEPYPSERQRECIGSYSGWPGDCGTEPAEFAHDRGDC